jgi:hypothetical protein
MQRDFGTEEVNDKKCTSQRLLWGTKSVLGCAAVWNLMTKNKLFED